MKRCSAYLLNTTVAPEDRVATVLTEPVSNTGNLTGTSPPVADNGLPSASTKPSKFVIVQVREMSMMSPLDAMVGDTSKVTPVFFLSKLVGVATGLPEEP